MAGYCDPPKRTRFKPGHSGNPSGRPKKQKGCIELINELLCQEVSVIDNGKKRKMTKRELIYRKIIHQAIDGDLKSVRFLHENDLLDDQAEPESIICHIVDARKPEQPV